MPVPCLTTALTGPLRELETRILNAQPQIEHWFRSQWTQYTPPFYGYTLTPGVTFTYLGLRVDAHAAVHWGGLPSPNLFAAGEVMAGNVLGQGYTAGVGMTIGTVFGRIAGREAARAAA